VDPKAFHRKLAAILSADVAGYSRLMQDDEAATVTTLESHKQAFFELIKQHRGRVVDSPGDNLLAEFASVVDAMQCSVAVQKELQARNAELAEHRRMLFRIGVNLGDVIEEESRIYGDGVNIAARLESLADPGGICVSKTAFDHIESKLPLGYEFLGEQTVKNIARPVGAYRVLLEARVTKGKGSGFRGRGSGKKMALAALAAVLMAAFGVGLWQFLLRPAAPVVEKADPAKMALPLPEQPSIAVLPFVNLSEDPKQQLLCDGITDNIISALSKVPRLFVIARNSTFTYKGKAVAAKQVSEELGVRYVLEGSVQRSGDRVRVNAQMVDALTGSQLLSERFDGETKDLFALQDDITMKVLGAVRIKLEGLGTSAWIKSYRGSQGLECFLKFQEGASHIQRMTVADTNQARQIAEEGLAVCPEGPAFYRLLAIVNLNDYQLGSSKAPQESIAKAEELLLKALALDENNAETHGNLSQVYTRKREYDKALAAAERGASLDPGSSWALYRYAIILNIAGRPEAAIPLFEKALRLNPIGPSFFYYDFGIALRDTGRLDEAVATLKKSVERAPNWFGPHAQLAVTYSMMGMDTEARVEAAEVLRINPRFSIEWVAKNTAYDQARMVKVFDAMRKAGLPDKPQPAQP
jgi:adenylate cyclase